MPKSFSIYLNTSNPKNYINLQPIKGQVDLRFYVDWNCIIPTEYKKFNLTTSLRSTAPTSAYTGMYFVSLNLSGDSYNQSSSQECICTEIIPKSYTVDAITTRTYMESNAKEQEKVTVNRPTNNYLYVKVFDKTGNIATLFPHFTLFLKFTVIEE